MSEHFIEQCQCGFVVSQCRCAVGLGEKKTVRIVPCTHPVPSVTGTPTPSPLTRFVPRILRDDGMIAASEVAHYTHLDLIQYVKVADVEQALAQQAQRIQELEDQRIRYGPICLNCGKDKPCMTEAEANQHGASIPCIFDPAPKELWQRCKQQAQEIERLHAEISANQAVTKTYDGDEWNEIKSLKRQLAAMTAERDNYLSKWRASADLNKGLLRDYDASQARVKELEKECAGLAAGSCEAPYGDDYGNKRCKTIDQLQATLAERERDMAKLKAELNETFVDEKETVWTRPTAWAYAMVCKARDKHEQEAGRMRNNVELMARDMCSMPSDLYQEWLDSDSQVHFRQWLAQRALKGA